MPGRLRRSSDVSSKTNRRIALRGLGRNQTRKDERQKTRSNYTEGVGKFKPRVELWQPWDHVSDDCWNPERFRSRCDSTRLGEPLQGSLKYRRLLSQGFKANPGLELANTFGVKTSCQENKKLSVCYADYFASGNTGSISTGTFFSLSSADCIGGLITANLSRIAFAFS